MSENIYKYKFKYVFTCTGLVGCINGIIRLNIDGVAMKYFIIIVY